MRSFGVLPDAWLIMLRYANFGYCQQKIQRCVQLSHVTDFSRLPSPLSDIYFGSILIGSASCGHEIEQRGSERPLNDAALRCSSGHGLVHPRKNRFAVRFIWENAKKTM